MTRYTKRKPHTSFCQQAKKVRYRDSLEAKMALARITNTSNRDRVPQRSYKCPHCKGWHLTSQNKRIDTEKLS